MRNPADWFRRLLPLLAIINAPILCAQGNGLQGWASFEQWDQAMAHAAEKQQPIVLLVYAFKGNDDTSPSANTARQWASHRGFAGMVRVHLTSSVKPDAVKAITAQVSDKTSSSPKLYIVTPTQRVVGYAVYKDRSKFDAALKSASQLLDWFSKAEKQIVRADQLTEQCHFDKALALIDEVAQDDRRATQAMMRQWSDLPADAPPPQTGQYFPLIDQTKRTAYSQAAADRIAQATHQYEDLRYQEALSTLLPLIRSKPVLPEQERARTMHEEIQAALKQQQAEVRAAEEAGDQ